MNDVVDIEKFISTLKPNEVIDLGKNLGLNPIELKKMNDITLNGDMIEAWINNEDKPTWRAFAKGLDLIKKGKFVRQIKEGNIIIIIHFLVYVYGLGLGTKHDKLKFLFVRIAEPITVYIKNCMTRHNLSYI